MIQYRSRWLGRHRNRVSQSESVAQMLYCGHSSGTQELKHYCGTSTFTAPSLRKIRQDGHSLTHPLEQTVLGEWETRSLWSIEEGLTSVPMLVLPKPEDSFILDSNASGNAIATDVPQHHDGQDKVKTFWSYTLNSEQRRYCTTCK